MRVIQRVYFGQFRGVPSDGLVLVQDHVGCSTRRIGLLFPIVYARKVFDRVRRVVGVFVQDTSYVACLGISGSGQPTNAVDIAAIVRIGAEGSFESSP